MFSRLRTQTLMPFRQHILLQSGQWSTHLFRTNFFSDGPSIRMSSSSSGPKPIIYVGGLAPSTTEESLKKYLVEKFQATPSYLKIVKDKVTNQSYLYGFINFDSKQQYDKVLAVSPHQIDGASVYTKATGPRYYKSVLYISNLSPSTTEEDLIKHFSAFGSVRSAHVMRDVERQSRGFAYVYFCSVEEQQKALKHPEHIIDNKTLEVRPKERVAEELTIYVGGLSPKTMSTDLSDFYSKYDRLLQSSVDKDKKTKRSKLFGYVTFATGEGLEAALNDEPHVINGKRVEVSYLDKSLCIFVGCISPNTTEDSLRKSMSKFGKIISCTVKSGYGFVIFDTRQAVESAMAAHPYKIDGTFVTMKQQQSKDQPQQVKLALYLQRLPVEATEEDLYNFYSKFGKVFKISIGKDEGANKAAGMVHFENEKEILLAMNSQPHEIRGQKVFAKISKPTEEFLLKNPFMYSNKIESN